MPVYLDHNATTPVDSAVVEAMLPYLREHFGNPSSTHRVGRAARTALETARGQVAELVGAHPGQVIFTSGGTEANNLALKGALAAYAPGRLAVGATEHPSVTAPARWLAARGWTLDLVPVDGQGRITPAALARVLGEPAPGLVSIMLANNETGVIQDIAALSAAARAHGALVHTDAVQAAGKIGVDFSASGAHFMSLSGHKLYGPKGVGALIVDKAVTVEPLLHGGGHERGLRAGTENVAAIVGFGEAARLARSRLAADALRISGLRQRLESGLRAVGGATIFAADAERLPNTVCFGVDGVDGETLLMGLDRAGMAVSSGSACSSGSTEPSPVLTAMGVEPELARSAVRASLGRGNSEQDIDDFIGALAAQVGRLRGMSTRATG